MKSWHWQPWKSGSKDLLARTESARAWSNAGLLSKETKLAPTRLVRKRIVLSHKAKPSLRKMWWFLWRVVTIQSWGCSASSATNVFPLGATKWEEIARCTSWKKVTQKTSANRLQLVMWRVSKESSSWFDNARNWMNEWRSAVPSLKKGHPPVLDLKAQQKVTDLGPCWCLWFWRSIQWDHPTQSTSVARWSGKMTAMCTCLFCWLVSVCLNGSGQCFQFILMADDFILFSLHVEMMFSHWMPWFHADIAQHQSWEPHSKMTNSSHRLTATTFKLKLPADDFNLFLQHLERMFQCWTPWFHVDFAEQQSSKSHFNVTNSNHTWTISLNIWFWHTHTQQNTQQMISVCSHNTKKGHFDVGCDCSMQTLFGNRAESLIWTWPVAAALGQFALFIWFRQHLLVLLHKT